MGEQDCCAANLVKSPGLLHGKMARAKIILASHRKTFAFQGCSPCSARVSSSRGRRQDHRNGVTLLQEQHKAQLKSMVAANKQAMDTMFERMNALIMGRGKAAYKVTAPVTNSNTGRAPSTTNHNKKRCTNRGKFVFHKPETCYELKTNASKRYPGWKSSKNSRALV
jgi:hypothetical protein